MRRQGGVTCRVLNVAMPEVGLDCTRVVARIRQSKAAGMTEHVGMRLDA